MPPRRPCAERPPASGIAAAATYVRRVKGVRKTTLFGQLDCYAVARAYPTPREAKRAWEQLEERSRGGDLSAVRVIDPATGRHVVIALGELEEPIKRAARRLARSGVPWELDDDIVQRLALRRARVLSACSEGKTGGYVNQRARYGDGGAVIDRQGQLSLRRRPQG